uniref:Uncharacterized protein n=1 Tax=Salix viminalis TaxID=40686 RepID=A0A6N2LR78_SALVM
MLGLKQTWFIITLLDKVNQKPEPMQVQEEPSIKNDGLCSEFLLSEECLIRSTDQFYIFI